jgi:hypothetical protein
MPLLGLTWSFYDPVNPPVVPEGRARLKRLTPNSFALLLEVRTNAPHDAVFAITAVTLDLFRYDAVVGCENAISIPALIPRAHPPIVALKVICALATAGAPQSQFD